MRKLLRLDRDTEIVDVEITPGDEPASYAALLESGDCRLTRFEPPLAPDGFPKARPGERFLPYLIGDGRDHSLYVCAHPGLTSLLEPNPRVVALYPDLQRNSVVQRRIEGLRTRRLDEAPEIRQIDLLRVRVHGGELAVLQGARQRLSNAVAVHTDVGFVELYKGQPSFGDIDLELKKSGFVLHHLDSAKVFTMAPSATTYINNGPSRQLITGEAVYFRDLSQAELMNEDQLKHLTVICHHYAAYDEARYCMGLLEKRRAIPRGTVLRYIGGA